MGEALIVKFCESDRKFWVKFGRRFIFLYVVRYFTLRCIGSHLLFWSYDLDLIMTDGKFSKSKEEANHADLLLLVEPDSNSSRSAIGARDDMRNPAVSHDQQRCLPKFLPKPLWSEVKPRFTLRKTFSALLFSSFREKMPSSSDQVHSRSTLWQQLCPKLLSVLHLLLWFLRAATSSSRKETLIGYRILRRWMWEISEFSELNGITSFTLLLIISIKTGLFLATELFRANGFYILRWRAKSEVSSSTGIPQFDEKFVASTWQTSPEDASIGVGSGACHPFSWLRSLPSPLISGQCVLAMPSSSALSPTFDLSLCRTKLENGGFQVSARTPRTRTSTQTSPVTSRGADKSRHLLHFSSLSCCQIPVRDMEEPLTIALGVPSVRRYMVFNSAMFHFILAPVTSSTPYRRLFTLRRVLSKDCGIRFSQRFGNLQETDGQKCTRVPKYPVYFIPKLESSQIKATRAQ